MSIGRGGLALLLDYSVKDYLVSKRISGGISAVYAMDSDLCHHFIARCCVQYLQQMGTGLDGFTLALYAAREWIRHAQSTDTEETQLSTDIYWLLGTSDETLLAWLQIYNPDDLWREPSPSLQLSSCASPLYYAVRAGFVIVTNKILKKGADVNAQGGNYGNALQAASSTGHGQIVKLLRLYPESLKALSSRHDLLLWKIVKPSRHTEFLATY